MISRNSGFHPRDPDWTLGRNVAISQAEGIARMQMGLSRKVALRPENTASPPYSGPIQAVGKGKED